MFLAMKYLITAAVVVLVSEISRRNAQLGALIAALPLVSFLVLMWMQVEKQSPQRIADHAWYTFWYVVPTLPMFLLFPWLQRLLGFWLALGASAVLTVILFVLWALLLRRFGILLLA